MKLQTIIAIICIFTHLAIAQTENYSITCPENTLLGVFSCEDVGDIPRRPGSIEEAMAPPYNIQIEGDIPSNLAVAAEDNGSIFFCEENLRMVTREIIFHLYEFEPWFTPLNEVARCSFTIETTVDTEPIGFIAPADELAPCNPFESYPGEVTFTGEDCFDIDQTNAFFTDQIKVEEETTFVVRTWQTTDACGNLADEQEQIITIDCERNSDYTIICPENTFLGTVSCFNVNEVPDQANTIEEAMAPPYNIQIEGDITNDIRAFTIDDGVIFYCESDPRIVNRNVIIYKDVNVNFVWDVGEEIGGCNYTIETERSPFPDFTAPADIEIDCGVEPDPENTGDYSDVETGCPVIDGYNIQFQDSVTINGNITTIKRTWQANILCDYLEKTQTITINCEPGNNFTINCPENTFLGVYDCNNMLEVPDIPNLIEEAMAPPYNIQIEGGITSDIRVNIDDDAPVFFCEDNARVVNRNVLIYKDLNYNFVYDIGEEIGSCSYTVETIPDLSPPEFMAPPDIEIPCGLNTDPDITGDVFTASDNCGGLHNPYIDFYDEIEEGDIITITRTWTATDYCGNSPEPQIQIITINCDSENDYTITCPENTLLGVYDCNNINDIPDIPYSVEEAMATPYNIQIEGEITSDIRVFTEDDGTVFYCPDDPRTVNRNIIIYKDFNFNFVWDIGEEIGICNYAIETIPDETPPQIIIPPDIEIACGVEPETRNTGDVSNYDDDCQRTNFDPVFYADELIVNDNITTILRTWIAFDACGNETAPQIQTITINCETQNDYTITCPENTLLGIVDPCKNIRIDPIFQIEEAMAPPYNILIEGDIPERLRISIQDDNTIFVCEENARIVNRKLTFYEDVNANYIYDDGEEVGVCNFTIETEVYLTVPEFTPPPDIELDCGTGTGPEITGDVTVVQFECTNISDGVEVYFSDVETTEGNITTIQRTWTAINFCGIEFEQMQTVTINCDSENDYTITCPENTILGTFGCEDIDGIPPPINTIEEAIAPPYNIQIEGELPPSTQVITEDNGSIFFCEENLRVVTREVIFCGGYFGCGGFEPYEILARCSFTIETIANVSIPQFTAPPDIEILCDDDRSPINTGDVNEVEVNCFLADGFELFFADTETMQGDITIVNRTWMATNACGDTSTQIQTITVNCQPVCTPPSAGTFNCGN